MARKRANHQIKKFLYTLSKGLCFVLVLATWMVVLSASTSYGAECGNSPIVFAFQGKIFAASGTGKLSVSEVASGFLGPYAMSWAPDCGEFAFLDAGSLWVAGENRTPLKLQIPGQVSSFVWSPNSKEDSHDMSPLKSSDSRRSVNLEFEVQGLSFSLP